MEVLQLYLGLLGCFTRSYEDVSPPQVGVVWMVPNKNAVFEKYEIRSLDMDRSECREVLGRTCARFEKL